NDEHEITATVTQNDGGGVDPAVGVTVVFTITSGTADFVGGDDDCVTNGSGQCSVSIFDDTPGANIIDATSTFSVGGVSLTRATDGNSGPDGSDAAEKTYIGGKIIVQKVTVGGDGSFNFNTDYSTDFQLSNGGSNDSGYIPTGSHSVSEDVPAGWDLTSATCTGDDDGIDPASIQLDDGEEVTCTFTNTKRGTITIVKDAQPNDCQDFAFTFTGKPDFSLDDNAGVADCTDTDRNQSQTFNNLPADNDYTAAETLPNAFWEFGGATCVNTGGSTPYTHTAAATNGITVTLDPGANVTCTFVNNKLGPTRTLGFWQTHTAYTTSQFAAHPFTIGDNSTHKGPIDISKVFGGFYAPISKTTSGSKRSAVDQARIQLLQQLLAAKLNCGTFGCSASIHTLITGADAAYVAGNKTAILNYASLLDAYNNSGDTIIIGNAGNATPKTSQGLADKAFWNAP
ncbi:MAG: hypothetical protein Q8O72_11340, partial [Bacteroidales bacterium]|nr:hypothetical protein [Bacteroidales bacterium]